MPRLSISFLPAGIIRHMRATADGNLLIHQSSTNRIILVNLKGATATQ